MLGKAGACVLTEITPVTRPLSPKQRPSITLLLLLMLIIQCVEAKPYEGHGCFMSRQV